MVLEEQVSLEQVATATKSTTKLSGALSRVYAYLAFVACAGGVQDLVYTTPNVAFLVASARA